MKLKRSFKQFIGMKSIFLFLLGMTIVTFSGWLGDIAYAFYRECISGEIHKGADGWAFLRALVIVFIASSLSLYLGVNAIKVRHLHQDKYSDKRDKCQAIIFCCSPLDPREKICESQKTKITKSKENGRFVISAAGEEKLTFTSSISEAITQLDDIGIQVKWQQQLRGLENKHQLEQIYIVGSHEMASKWEDNSTDLVRFKAFIESFYLSNDENRPKVEVVIATETANKDSMSDYYKVINHCIKQAEKAGISNEKIIVDVTSGQVPASIAGSLATLHNDAGIQYVNNDGITTSYNVEVETRKDT
jgi:hypothetical protein